MNASLTAFDIYDAAFDSAQSEWIESSKHYIHAYAECGLDVYPSDEIVGMILACRLEWLAQFEADGWINGEDSFFHIVEEPLRKISVNQAQT